MHKQTFLGVFLVFIILLAGGCGNHVKVTGKVTFPDDTPLTVGKVVFETDSFAASGPLKDDGTYTLGSIKEGDGIPPGTYRVSVSGAMKAGEAKNVTTSSGGVSSTVPMALYTSAIDPKYSKGATSGITCEVKKSTTFDFKVDPPK